MAGAAHPFRIGGPAAASLLVNALLIAALLNLGMGHASRRAETPAMTVLSLALLKGVEQGKEEAETAAPSTPAAVPPPPADPLPVSQSTAVAIVAPPVAVAPSRLSLSVSVQPTAAASAAPPASQPDATGAPSAALSARRGATDGLDVKASAGTSRSYAARIRSWLYAHKIYPRRARMRREEGLVQVRFVLNRAGMLVEGIVLRGSGHTALDQEAEAMMRRASPYPHPPADLPGERIEFTVPIDFSLST